jgi:hypothetical protein
MTAQHSLRLPAFGHEHGSIPRTGVALRCDAHFLLFGTLHFTLLHSHDSYGLFPCGWSASKGNPNEQNSHSRTAKINHWMKRDRAQASRNGPLPHSEEKDHHPDSPQPHRAKVDFLVPDAVIHHTFLC